MTTDKEAIIVATINSPYKKYMGVNAVVKALKNCKPNCTQIYSFFIDISVDDQLEFAQSKGITKHELIQTAKKISEMSGQKMPICVEQKF